jgi:ABC-type cobalamin/Fe3+-siderophores transport system ATPase subunit
VPAMAVATAERLTGQDSLALSTGETLFVVGANGTGKSSLLQRFASLNNHSARRISASRQTWFQSSAIEFRRPKR